MKKVALFLGRLFSVVVCGFLAVFILEAFDPNFGWQSGVAHLIPTVIMSLLTVYSWKKPFCGGLLFLGVATILFCLGISHLWRESVYLVIIFGVIGGLFILGSKQHS